MANMNMTIRVIVSFIKATTQKIHVSVEKTATAYIKQVSSLTTTYVSVHPRSIFIRDLHHFIKRLKEMIRSCALEKKTETNERTNRLDKNKLKKS